MTAADRKIVIDGPLIKLGDRIQTAAGKPVDIEGLRAKAKRDAEQEALSSEEK